MGKILVVPGASAPSIQKGIDNAKTSAKKLMYVFVVLLVILCFIYSVTKSKLG